MAGGEIANTHNYWWTTMPLDDCILKTQRSYTQWKNIRKTYSQGDKKVLDQNHMKEIILRELDSKKKKFKLLYPQETFSYGFVDIHQFIMSIKELSQRKPQFLSSGRKCFFLQLIGFGIHKPDWESISF